MIDPSMIKRLQADLHQRIDDTNRELSSLKVEGTSGGGVVKVIATGNRDIVGVKIGPEAIDPDDPEMLQDLIMAAVNQALENAKKLHEEKMAGITGGLKFPGLL
ncbi:MAG: YbaB/EbfC family nucleoid-associated protein [Candidatus Sumerlaeia bacterium]|nr:YbaB/EbfC family nucleoid-associated protein [Candidatus Sumerlaeia bacterium]